MPMIDLTYPCSESIEITAGHTRATLAITSSWVKLAGARRAHARPLGPPLDSVRDDIAPYAAADAGRPALSGRTRCQAAIFMSRLSAGGGWSMPTVRAKPTARLQHAPPMRYRRRLPLRRIA